MKLLGRHIPVEWQIRRKTMELIWCLLKAFEKRIQIIVKYFFNYFQMHSRRCLIVLKSYESGIWHKRRYDRIEWGNIHSNTMISPPFGERVINSIGVPADIVQAGISACESSAALMVNRFCDLWLFKLKCAQVPKRCLLAKFFGSRDIRSSFFLVVLCAKNHMSTQLKKFKS